MGMFTRLTDIINANINSMLDKAENPEKMIRLIIQEMEETLVEVRSVAAKNIAEQKNLKRQLSTIGRKAENWREKAEMALAKGREDLARSALVEKSKTEQQAEGYQQELDVIEGQLEAVQEDCQRLQSKLSEARRRQDALVVRQESASARLKVREKISTHNIDDAINRFERYQQHIDGVEAKVEAFDMTEPQDLASQINALANEENIENELAELKKKVVNG